MSPKYLLGSVGKRYRIGPDVSGKMSGPAQAFKHLYLSTVMYSAAYVKDTLALSGRDSLTHEWAHR
jgi:hypothetical protein